MGKYQVVRSKMKKTNVLLSDAELSRHIPKTESYSVENLEAMLLEFPRVYVKPDRGRGGKRVILLMRKDDGYQIRYETTKKQIADIDEAVDFIDNIACGDPFIVQQGIGLLRIGRTPFDIRVNVQKPYSRWRVTTMIVKLMAPGKVVTNYCQGSTLVHFDKALLQAGLTRTDVNQVKERLTYLGERTANVLSTKYPGLRELGLDIALDYSVEPWILEVNTKPKYPEGLDETFDSYRRVIKRRHK